MRFVWFLNFWGWSRESHRAGMLLHPPLQGISGNWDEWFRNEATEGERAEIEFVGQSEKTQWEFWEWLGGVWIHDAVRNGNRLALFFVGDELARVAPFDQWPAFTSRPRSLANGVISAVVLGGESEGQAADVRPIAVTLLPTDTPRVAQKIVPDGFQADQADLNVARESALQLLRGRAGWALLARWVAMGRRPYSRGVIIFLAGGWLGVALLIAWLWVGPDPGSQLRAVAALLVVLWSTLVLGACCVVGVQIFVARRAAREGAEHLAQDQIRISLPGRFTLKGGSAGLAFSLGILDALGRAYPRSLGRSWVWRQFAREFEKSNNGWAATGTTTASGQIQRVELNPKLRSCIRHGDISDLLAPVQLESSAGAVSRLTAELVGADGTNAARNRLRVHRCHHVADAILAVGRLTHKGQLWGNVAALGLSGIVAWAIPDLLGIVFPPPVPSVVAPSSPSPYFLWVSLDTRRPEFFAVVLDSPVWANRRVPVESRTSLPASVRAEIRLVRLSESSTRNLEEGVVWIERSPRFLTRRFEPGEMVGRYTLSYLNRLRHD